MHLDPWILTFSAATVLVTIWMGFWSARRSKTASDFFVAGRSVSVGWNASAISGEYLSAASFMGVAGMVMSSGYDALWYPVCYACGYLFLLLFIAGPLRRFGAYTIPDFAEGRFDSPLFRKIAVVFVLFIGFFYTMPQMKGAGTTLSYIFQDLDFRGTPLAFLAPHEKGEALKGLHYGVGVFLVGAVITLNVALGGMKGITLVQAFQYWMKMFAISVPVFVLMAVYGHYGKQVGVNAQRPTSNVQLSTNATVAALDVGSSKLDVERSLLPKTIQEYRTVLNQPDFGMFYLDFTKVLSGPTNTLSLENLKFRLDELTGRRNTTMGKTKSIGNLVANYSAVTRKRVSFGSSWLALTKAMTNDITYDDSQPKTRRETLELMEGILRTNGGFIFPLNQTNVVLLTQADLEGLRRASPGDLSGVGRKPLPDNAPRDETWLNPFGPLTTKAAKAAPGTMSYSGPWHTGSVMKAYASVTLYNAMDKLGRVNTQVGDTGRVAATVMVMNYAYFLARAEPLNFGEEMRILSSPAVTTLQVNWPGFPQKPHRKVADTILKTLETNGVVVIREERDTFKAFTRKEATITPIDSRPYSLLYTYSLIIALVCGTAGLPHILVRFYTNPDGVAAKRTTMWVMILIGVFYLFPPVFGVMGRNLMPSLYEGAGAKGTDKVVLELPRVLDAGKGGKGEREKGRDDAIPPAPFPPGSLSAPIANGSSKFPWGSILSGITCAGAFAAFMSTFSGLLVSMTGAMAHDVYGRMLNPKATGEQRLRAFKIAAVAIGGGAVLLGFLVESFEINKMVGWAFAIAATSYFPLLFLSTWWRGITMKGAATGMLVGGTLSLVAIASTMFADQAAWAAGLKDYYAARPLLRILAEQPAIWALPLAMGLMFVLSKLTAKDIPADIRMKMLVLHAPEKLGLKQEYIQEHQQGH